MSDVAFDNTRWPEIPEDLDPKVASVLREMMNALDKRLSGTVALPGDVAVGGYLILMGPDRIKSLLPSA